MGPDRKLETPTVKDILKKNVVAFGPDFTILDAIKSFNKYNLSTAPVVNDQNVVVGYISENDCIKCLSNNLFYDDLDCSSIDLIMSKQVEVAQLDWDIFKLENFFVFKHIKSAPVVDSENHLVGVVTRRDILLELEKCIEDRQDYKGEIKTPVELNLQEKVKIILLNDTMY